MRKIENIKHHGEETNIFKDEQAYEVSTNETHARNYNC
jgi:hypothetical protein